MTATASQTLAQRSTLRSSGTDFARNFAWPVFGEAPWSVLHRRMDWVTGP